jgi:hypothetical protein
MSSNQNLSAEVKQYCSWWQNEATLSCTHFSAHFIFNIIVVW